MDRVPDITPELLRKLLTYNHDTGLLTWNVRGPDMFGDYGIGGAAGNAARWNAQFAGKPALDSVSPGWRRTGTIFGKKLAAHRVIWAMVHDEWPDEIDHIDGNAGNNRLDNLRAVSHAENMRNRAKQANNRSGVTGVCWSERRSQWEAYIKVSGKKRGLGWFKSRDDAIAARVKAERESGFSPRHGKFPSAYSI